MFWEYSKSFDNLYSILLPSVGPVQTSRVAFIRPSFDTTRAVFTKDKVPLQVYFSPGLIRWSPRSSCSNVTAPNYERIIGTFQKHKNHRVSIHTCKCSSSNSEFQGPTLLQLIPKELLDNYNESHNNLPSYRLGLKMRIPFSQYHTNQCRKFQFCPRDLERTFPIFFFRSRFRNGVTTTQINSRVAY